MYVYLISLLTVARRLNVRASLFDQNPRTCEKEIALVLWLFLGRLLHFHRI